MWDFRFFNVYKSESQNTLCNYVFCTHNATMGYYGVFVSCPWVWSIWTGNQTTNLAICGWLLLPASPHSHPQLLLYCKLTHLHQRPHPSNISLCFVVYSLCLHTCAAVSLTVGSTRPRTPLTHFCTAWPTPYQDTLVLLQVRGCFSVILTEEQLFIHQLSGVSVPVMETYFTCDPPLIYSKYS